MNIRPTHSLLKCTVTLVAALTARTAFAHPGHGPLEHGLMHPLTSPYHLVTLLLLGIVLLVAARGIRQTPLRRVMNWTGCGALTGAALLWGLGAPVW